MKDRLLEYITEDRIYINEPLCKYTSFNIGGPADYFVKINNEEELKQVISLAKENNVPFYLLGNGSNILVGDKGFRGIVIKLGGAFEEVITEGDIIKAGAAITLAKIAKEAMDNSLTGFEFAAGIPGSLGGALVMNAGAYGGEMKQVVTSVKMLMANGDIEIVDNQGMDFGYRHSILKENGGIALGCTIKLQPGDKDSIRAYMQELAIKRKEKQPLEYPSAGSTFKRPEGKFAGKLIEDSGLGGFSVGDAQVSEKHKGFVINKGNASAKDVKELIDQIIEIVKDKQGVTLEPEVIMVGDFG